MCTGGEGEYCRCVCLHSVCWCFRQGTSCSCAVCWSLLVVVVISGESYYFVFEKWFAVEKGDGKVEREVMAADRGLGFSKVSRSVCWRMLRLRCIDSKLLFFITSAHRPRKLCFALVCLSVSMIHFAANFHIIIILLLKKCHRGCFHEFLSHTDRPVMFWM